MSERKDLTETYQDFARQMQSGVLINSRYRIIRLLGSGGMGRVYLAKDEQLNIDVALKMLRPDLGNQEAADDRLKNELLLARRVSHKNVARIHDLGEIDGLKFLTMSYIEGKTLRDMIREEGALTPDQTHSIALQIAEAMAAAHDEGVVHRDLKPGNILLNESCRAFVADFGIASSKDTAHQTSSGIVVGTPAYFSPEQLWGENADQRTDIYAFGLILYEMLTGSLPFDAGKAFVFKSRPPTEIKQEIRKYNPEAPDYLIEIIRKCLQPGRDRRYQDARSIVIDLTQKQVAKPVARSNALLRYGAVGAIILLIVTGYFVRQKLVANKPVPQAVKESVTNAPSILVLPFVIRNTDADLSWAESGMMDLLITDLSRQANFRVISSERIFQTMADLKIPDGTYSDDMVKKVAEMLNADWVVRGTLTQAGANLRADLQLIDRFDPQKTVRYQANGNRTEDLLQMSDSLAMQIHKQFQTPHPETPHETKSIVALRAYQEGTDLVRSGDYDRAIESLQGAIRSDPAFLKPYFRLSQAFEAKGDFDSSISILEKAMNLNPSGDSRTRELILAQHALSTGEMEKAIELYKKYVQAYPNDSEVLFQMALASEQSGDPKQAAGALEKVVALDPNHPEAYFHLGKDTILMGEPEKAINNYLFKALGISNQLKNRHSEADVLNAIGVANERLGRYEDAVKYYQNSISLKEQIGNRKGEATSLSNIAKIYIFQGKYDDAKQLLDRTLKIFTEINDAKGIADTTNQFGVIAEDIGKYNEALTHYRKAMQIRKELGNDQLTAQSYDNVGHIYYLQGNYENAEVFWQQALSLRKTIGEESGVILSQQNMGFLQIARGDLDQASKSFLESLQQSRAIQYENAVAVSLGNLGVIHQRQGRYSAALESYKEAIAVLEKLKDPKGIAEYTKHTGSVYLELHDFDQGLQKLNSALQMAGGIQSPEIVADVHILLARAERLRKESDLAKTHVKEAMQIASQQQYEKALAYAQIEQGWLFMEDGDVGSAAKVFDKIRKEAMESNDPWLLLAANYGSTSVSLQAKQFPHAIEVSTASLNTARKMSSYPYLFRFSSIAGQACMDSNFHSKAKVHFQEGSKALAEITKNLSPESAQRFQQIPEVARLKAELKKLGG